MGEGRDWRSWVAGFLLAGVFCLSAALAGAQQEPRLTLNSQVEKEVKAQRGGKWVTERIPVDKTAPGDILVYTINYQNAGTNAAKDAAIVDPLPAGVVYLPNSAEGQETEITCSIDGGRSWHNPPVMVQIKKPDGTQESKAAAPEQYTHIRWVIKKPIPPGQSGQVQFKVTVK
jgi:uncharacterized repeat protein (TIGR01451 family)